MRELIGLRVLEKPAYNRVALESLGLCHTRETSR